MVIIFYGIYNWLNLISLFNCQKRQLALQYHNFYQETILTSSQIGEGILKLCCDKYLVEFTEDYIQQNDFRGNC